MFLLIVSTNHFKVYIKNKHLSGNYSISKYLEIWESDRSNFAKYWIFIQEKLLLYCIFSVITRLLISVLHVQVLQLFLTFQRKHSFRKSLHSPTPKKAKKCSILILSIIIAFSPNQNRATPPSTEWRDEQI